MGLTGLHVDTLDHLAKSSLAQILYDFQSAPLWRLDNLILAQEHLGVRSLVHLRSVLLDVVQNLVTGLLVIQDVPIILLNLLGHF
jgi:hypothetical protein